MSNPKILPGEMLVRPMQRHDLPIVAALMARLAHERRDTEPMDVAILQSLLFDPAPALLGLAAERFGCTVGYALLRREDDMLFLDQLALMEGSRGLGLGRAMVVQMRLLADRLGCRRLLATRQAGAPHAAGFCESVGLQMEEAVRMLA